MLEDGLLDGLVCSTSCTNLPLLMWTCDSATQRRCLSTSGLTLKAAVEDLVLGRLKQVGYWVLIWIDIFFRDLDSYLRPYNREGATPSTTLIWTRVAKAFLPAPAVTHPSPG